jgi:hypothetical protein
MRCSAAVILLLVAAAVAGATADAGPEPTCPRTVGPPFLDALGSRCHRVRIDPSPPLEVAALSPPSPSRDVIQITTPCSAGPDIPRGFFSLL